MRPSAIEGEPDRPASTAPHDAAAGTAGRQTARLDAARDTRD